jgi:hypothetical protein
MTTFSPVEGGSLASTSTHPAASAIVIKLMIEEGRLDEYLKSIFDSVKDRKSKLSSSGTPTVQCDPYTFDFGSISTAPATPIPAAAPTVTTRPKPAGTWKAKQIVLQRPSLDTPVFQGQVYAIPDGQAASHEAKDIAVIFGKAYLKSDIVGKYFFHSVNNGNGVRAKVVGIGPKMIKFLLADEPDAFASTGKDNWHACWVSNTPMFLPHSAIQQWFV